MTVHNPNPYTIKKMLPEAWQAYKAIRLEALSSNPEMFGSNFQKESGYTDEQWISFLSKTSRALFGLYYADELVGLTAVSQQADNPQKAILYASYIRAAHRGQGLTNLFFEARIAWARHIGCTSLSVSHRAGNEASKAAILGHKFSFTRAEKITWPDGHEADEVFYNRPL